MDTKTFSTKAVLSLYTGVLLSEFSEMHELIEFVCNRPVWTHELASQSLFDEMQERLLREVDWLQTVDTDAIPKSADFDDRDEFVLALNAWTARYTDLYGETQTLSGDEFTEQVGSYFMETLSLIGSKRGQQS